MIEARAIPRVCSHHLATMAILSAAWCGRDASPASEIQDPLLQDLMQASPPAARISGPESSNHTEATEQIPADTNDRPVSPDREAGSQLEDLSHHALWQRMVARMRKTERRIAVYDTSPETCALQDQVLKELDWLIERAQHPRGSEQTSGQGANRVPPETPPPAVNAASDPQEPSSDSGPPPEPGRSPEGREADSRQAARQLINETWGHLPDRKREPLLNAPVDQFLPEYKDLIEDYYERLSRQRSLR